MNNSVFDELKFDADGLLPAIAVDDHSGAVLMSLGLISKRFNQHDHRFRTLFFKITATALAKR